MEFFDKLGKKASEAYKVTADKTGKIAKEAKLKMKMADLKGQANDIYMEIGKKVYEKHVKEETLDIKKELEEECTKLDVISDEIDSILKECIDLKDKKVCQKCYSQIEKNMKFCPECGAKQEETEKNEDVKQVEVVEETNSDEKEPEITTENIDGKIEINETPGNANLTEEEKEQAQENLEKTVAIEADVETENDSDIEE
ncbi:MAG: hypothetical protein BHW01_06605 [Clostridium sp. 27_14]|nr:MAG: hypothetical protein BHW01_06605 [Clostridium sp. 27_14]